MTIRINVVRDGRCFSGQSVYVLRPEATVDLKDEVLQKTPNPQEKAKYLAMEILKSEIEKDHQFKSGYHWEVELMEVDLSEYATPNLTAAAGRAWLN